MPKGNLRGFTLPELLIAVGIFATVVTIVSSLYIQSFRESRKANLQNQIYEDSRYILQLIADEVRNGIVDYDEYYNQSVLSAGSSQNFGQNYGKYYSAFYNPGADWAYGFDCNDAYKGGTHPYDPDAADAAGIKRKARRNIHNLENCVPLRRTLDRNTGANPFAGKVLGATTGSEENAFCGTASTQIGAALSNRGISADGRQLCNPDGSPNLAEIRIQPELYLISADGRRKTILAREKIGETNDNPAKPIYALSILRLKGVDINSDNIADKFVCDRDAGFECRGGNGFDVLPNSVAELNNTKEDACFGGNRESTDLPRSRSAELETFDANDACDPPVQGFSKDFIPITPFRVNVVNLNFYISPVENPDYAFAEPDQQEQPSVTIVLTVEPNLKKIGLNAPFAPLTLTQTVRSRILTPIPAPLLVQ